MSRYKSFETARLLLRPTDLNDAEFIYKLKNTPKWLKNIGNKTVHSVSDVKEQIENKTI